jgi:hypothetical protein
MTRTRIITILVIVAFMGAFIFHRTKKETPSEEPATAAEETAPAATTSSEPAPTPAKSDDLWANCPPPEMKKSLLSQEKPATDTDGGVHVEFFPVAAYGDYVTVKTLVTNSQGSGGATAEFFTCDIRQNKRMMLRDILSDEAIARAAQQFAPEAAAAERSMATMENFAVTGIEEDRNTFYILMGDSGPRGELDARLVEIKLSPEETSSLSLKMQAPRPKVQPYDNVENLYHITEETD